MKKLSIWVPVVLFFISGSASAQVADSGRVDTMVVDTIPPDAPGSGETELDQVEEEDEPDAIRRLRLMREEKERINEELEDVISYPLNLETDNLASFQVLDSIADHNRFIFTGEDHRVEKFNTVLEMKMMQYLNTKGYQYYLMEAGWVSAWMVNRYIVDGDSAAEQILSTYYSANFFDMFRGLKETNDSLAPDKKITAVGLDLERDAPLALRGLLLMLPDKQAPDSLEMFIESLKILSAIHIEQAKEYSENQDNSGDIYDFGGYEFDTENEEYDGEGEAPKYFYFNMMKTIQDLTQRFRAREPEFKVYLGDNYTNFEQAIKEMENWLVWIGYEKNELPQSWVYREQYMEGNFRSMFKDKPEAKGFGQFGRCHITRVTKVGDCGFAFFTSLNKRIITRMPELENRLSSIGIFYGGLDNNNRVDDNGNVNDLIKLTDKGTVNLFMDLEDYGDEMLRTKFSSVIVVKSSNYSEKVEDNSDGDNDTEPESDIAFSFDFNIVQRTLDMGSFNSFTNFGAKGTFLNYEIGMTTQVDRVVGSTSFGFFSGIESVVGDSSTQRLKGWNFRYVFGGDLIRGKRLELSPTLGIGFMQLRYSEERKTGGLTPFGTHYYTEFTNPAFLIDGRLNAGLVLGFVKFQGFVGYNLDVSKSSWRQQKNPIIDGPKTKFSGAYTGFGICLGRFN
ncbi:MAG: erythromycin esterase family protein [Bacteroidia bacterium]